MSLSSSPPQTAWTSRCASVRRRPWVQCCSVNSAGMPSTVCVSETRRTPAQPSPGSVRSAIEQRSPPWTKSSPCNPPCGGSGCACRRATPCTTWWRGHLTGSTKHNGFQRCVTYRSWRKDQGPPPPSPAGCQAAMKLKTTLRSLISCSGHFF